MQALKRSCTSYHTFINWLIINLSIKSCIFPDDWKIAKVTRVFKEGSKSGPNNYRPISVLPIVSKIIEKIIFNQLYNYLTEYNLLADSQHGFRPMHSTLTALLEATNDWYFNIDNGLLNGVLFLGLKKAFDTVYLYILLEELKLYGVDIPSYSWFTSYLLNRKQLTCVSGSLSNEQWSSSGSVLGPLLFLIYINDLKACPFSSYARMYADDTCLTASAIDPEMLKFKLNHDLEVVRSWLHANKLTLNINKVSYNS